MCIIHEINQILKLSRKFNRIRRRKNTYKIILAFTDICIVRVVHIKTIFLN